jgi:hypothetical protein
MIQTLLILFAILSAAIAAIITGALLLLAWVARGESDVNGDPERDAGVLEQKLHRHGRL